jgi:hypothetical protein
VAGTGSYGHEVKHYPDGTYEIESGWGGATDVQFEGNKYLGRNVDLPQDPTAVIDPNYRPAKLDWTEPAFDPAHPEQFSVYLAKHRQWMLHLFARQFGRPPHLEDSSLSTSPAQEQ